MGRLGGRFFNFEKQNHPPAPPQSNEDDKVIGAAQ
jgi:hypothetical protein